MRAAVITEPREIAVSETPDPRPAPHQVVVDVGACGVCGTDLHIADGEFPPTPYPIVPGHEFAGTVGEIGADVTTGIAVGDRVAVDPSLFCGHCVACRAGRGNLCANWGAIGDTVDGAFAERVAVPAVNAYRLPDHLSLEQGALVEPLSCAVHGVRRLGTETGESMLVVGAGTMGLLLIQLLVGAGVRVNAVDRVASKLDLATKFGAVHTATSISELDGQYDAVVDVTGAPAAIEEGLDAVRRGGRFLVFGVANADARVAVSPFRIYNDEITIVGSMAVLHSFGAALDLVATGSISTDGLVSHRFPLDDYPDALDIVRQGQGVKVHVRPGEEPA
ncbi:MAG TPA: zinc-dependent alcohol dehydrogenase family protein [Nocardioidaceae bacterium]|nr:zinc-dependent alcohol dehydrogenase family protein [Nocardioidaceae bacterium]